MMKKCDHASFCGKRMAHGDRINGCNDVDQASCSAMMSVKEATPTAAPAPSPMVKCTACYRQLRAALAQGKSCVCGSWSWTKI